MTCSAQDAIVIADALPTSCASNWQIGSENVPEAHAQIMTTDIRGVVRMLINYLLQPVLMIGKWCRSCHNQSAAR